ncbi:GPS domain-containing protein, partial [Trichonephila clavata]
AKIPTSVLARGHSNTAEALQLCNSDSDVSKRVKNVLEFFVEKISSTVPLGSKVVLSSKYPGYPSTLIFRQLLERTPIYIKALSDNGLMEGSVRFEDAVREKVRNRKCKKKAADCEGVVVALTLYPSQAPYPPKPKRTSPVMDVTLRKPEDGLPLSVSDVPNAIKIALTHKGNVTEAQEKGIIYKCSFWDEKLKEWSSEDIVTYGVDGNVMKCWSSHLTVFAVIETYGGLSTGAIVGIVVTVLMGIFIIMMFAFFFFRKKQAAKTRVSHETLPRRDKLQSSNGSTVKVKAITP